MATFARWDALERAHLGVPRGQSSLIGAATPLTEQATPPSNPPTNLPHDLTPNPLPPYQSATTSLLSTSNTITDRDALPYIHNTDRIDVNRMLTDAKRRIELFKEATPPRSIYFPLVD